MNSDQDKIKKNQNNHKATPCKNSLPIPTAKVSERLTSEFGEVMAASAGDSLWNSIGSKFIVLYLFVIVLFYMVRFAASAWVAGARGIYGL
jgi:hypothetical protein